MTTPTPDPLALAEEAERMANAATPGPWRAGRPDMATIVDGVESKWIYDALGEYMAVASGWGERPWHEVIANAEFIARARELVPALAAALRAAHEENKRLVTQAAELGKWRDAVLNAAVVDWTYRKEHETDPVRAVNDLVCYALDVEREALRKENQRLREALPLARLGLAALEVSRDGDNWDGWDIQDAAVSLGAVVSVEVGYGRYCGEDCRCAEMAADYCYRDAPSTITTRALAGGKGEG